MNCASRWTSGKQVAFFNGSTTWGCRALTDGSFNFCRPNVGTIRKSLPNQDNCQRLHKGEGSGRFGVPCSFHRDGYRLGDTSIPIAPHSPAERNPIVTSRACMRVSTLSARIDLADGGRDRPLVRLPYDLSSERTMSVNEGVVRLDRTGVRLPPSPPKIS